MTHGLTVSRGDGSVQTRCDTVKLLKNPRLVVYRTNVCTPIWDVFGLDSVGLDSVTHGMTNTWVRPGDETGPLESEIQWRSDLEGVCVGSCVRLKPFVSLIIQGLSTPYGPLDHIPYTVRIPFTLPFDGFVEDSVSFVSISGSEVFSPRNKTGSPIRRDRRTFSSTSSQWGRRGQVRYLHRFQKGRPPTVLTWTFVGRVTISVIDV